jgi:hypothetical protein
MDFLFYVLFFYTADAAVTEIQTVSFVNIEFRERKPFVSNFLFQSFFKLFSQTPNFNYHFLKSI